jgi:small-conductance mechanosensitive channel
VAMIGVFVALLSPGRSDGAEKPAATSSDQVGVPVVFDGETVAVATGKVGAFSPSDRAVAIASRLRKVTDDWGYDPDTISVAEAKDGSEIVVGDQSIMVVSDADARAAGKLRQVLADEFAQRFRQVIKDVRNRHSLRYLLLGSLKAILATTALIVGLALMRALGRRSLRWLDEVQARSGRENSLGAIFTHGLSLFLSLVLRLLAWPTVVLLLLTYLHYVLYFFPTTAPLGRAVHQSATGILLLVLDRVIAYAPNLLVVALIVVVTRSVLKVARSVMEGFELRRLHLSGFSPDWAKPTYNIVRFAILALMVVVLYPYLPGSESAAFRGVSVFLGLLLSLGSSSVIANALAGAILTYMRSLQPGDFVQIGEQTGTVVEKALLVTRIRTTKNVIITLPNSLTLTTPVRNLSVKAREEGVILYTPVTIGHDVPWRTVNALLLAAAEGVEGVRSEPKPFVLQMALTESGVRYELNVYSDQPARQSPIFTALHQNIRDRFHEAGIAIRVPSFISLLDGDGRVSSLATASKGAGQRDGVVDNTSPI